MNMYQTKKLISNKIFVSLLAASSLASYSPYAVSGDIEKSTIFITTLEKSTILMEKLTNFIKQPEFVNLIKQVFSEFKQALPEFVNLIKQVFSEFKQASPEFVNLIKQVFSEFKQASPELENLIKALPTRIEITHKLNVSKKGLFAGLGFVVALVGIKFLYDGIRNKFLKNPRYHNDAEYKKAQEERGEKEFKWGVATLFAGLVAIRTLAK